MGPHLELLHTVTSHCILLSVLPSLSLPASPLTANAPRKLSQQPCRTPGSCYLLSSLPPPSFTAAPPPPSLPAGKLSQLPCGTPESGVLPEGFTFDSATGQMAGPLGKPGQPPVAPPQQQVRGGWREGDRGPYGLPWPSPCRVDTTGERGCDRVRVGGGPLSSSTTIEPAGEREWRGDRRS